MFRNGKLGWVWGEKEQAPQKMSFEGRQRAKDEIKQKVRLTLELDVAFPNHLDIVTSLINSHLTFDVPLGVNVMDVTLTHLDLLEYVKRVEV